MLKIGNLSVDARNYFSDFAIHYNITDIEALNRIIIQHHAKTSNFRALANAFEKALTFLENEEY